MNEIEYIARKLLEIILLVNVVEDIISVSGVSVVQINLTNYDPADIASVIDATLLEQTTQSEVNALVTLLMNINVLQYA